MKNILFSAMMATMCVVTSCDNEATTLEPGGETTPAGKAHIKLVCGFKAGSQAKGTPQGIAPRAVLTANGRELTDLYIFDYDKASGRLLQVLHQTSTTDDFAEPDLTLDYGEHVLKVVATASVSPSLLDAAASPWALTPNVLTPVSSAAVPVCWTSDKTSDSFGALKEVTVGIGQSQAVSIVLDRLVARLKVNSTDEFPADCSTIDVDLEEYRQFSFADFSVIGKVKNQRISDVSSLAGKKGTTVSYYLLVPEGGYTTDVTFTTNRKKGTPFSTITVPGVKLERNKVTTITGSFYNHQQGLSITLNDAWSAEGNEIKI